MNRSLNHLALAGGLALLLAYPSWGQGQQPSQPSTPPSQPSPGAGADRGNTRQPENRTQPNREQQLPLFIEGQVINENAQAPDPISVRLSCGMRTLQTVKTDIRGYFRFALGSGLQSNMDFSAADEAPPASMLTGVNIPGGYSGFGSSGNGLSGCDIRISVPGYVPMDLPITDPASLGIIDVGVLEMRRIGAAPVGSVSATSLLVPKNARKEFEQGVKDLRNNRLPQAQQHLERAVSAYDKYAAAWTELGRIYAVGRDMAKAREAYGKAIAADPKFAPPYVSLGAVQLEERDFDGALQSIARAVEIDPAITAGLAGYIQGVANFRLNRPEAARESLQQAEKAPHPNTPQLHVILADLYLREGDSASAATHIRTYLKEAPQGSFAVAMRNKLAEIDQAAANDTAGSSGSPAVAP